MNNVKKRDGTLVDYDSFKIENAILMAMREVGEENYDIASSIAEFVKNDLLNKESTHPNEVHNVEDIQDMVVEYLNKMTKKSGTRYSIHREYRTISRYKDKKYELLTDDFISKYKHVPAPLEGIGMFVYYRTYSRWLPNERRREYWWETVRRAVEYNVSLDTTLSHEKAKSEAEELFDNIYNLRQFLSGRTFWVGRTEVAKKYPTGNFNCAHTVIDSFKKFKDIFYLLMVGAGVGVNVRKQYVDKMPMVRTDYELVHSLCTPVPKDQRQEHTSIRYEHSKVYIVIGDSKEGWAEALDTYLSIVSESSFKDIRTIIIVYDHVRPKGEKLKTFGGTASGHESLLYMFKGIDRIIKTASAREHLVKFKVRPIDCMDIANIIGENVVSGGVRRTSEIILFDVEDDDILYAKSNLYLFDEDGTFKGMNPKLKHRQMSNNSIIYDHKPSRERLHKQIEAMRYSGEPGWVNRVSALKRNPHMKGVNPCGEILLDDNGLCNLVTVNWMGFVEKTKRNGYDYLLGSLGFLNLTLLKRAFELATRAAFRMTLASLELSNWDIAQKAQRLLGVSFTGWQDMINSIGLDHVQKQSILIEIREIIHNTGNNYADSLGLNRPDLMTTVKPEGTLSQLPTVSSGVHFSHSPYYVRRVRISATDPLTKVCEELKWPVYPEVGQDPINPKTKYVEFPVRAPKGRTKFDVSAIEQLEEYKLLMENYVDHNCSITVHVRENEWEEVEQWVWDNWDICVALSFLSLDDNFYEALPYEKIDEPEYRKRLSMMSQFRPSMISKYETEETDYDIGNDECEFGICPIR